MSDVSYLTFPDTYFVSLSGPDTISLIDPLTTQDTSLFLPDALSYTLFLNIKGRIIATCLVWKITDENILLEVADQTTAEELATHLRRYKLRSKCEIEVKTLCKVIFTHVTVDDIAQSLWLDPRYMELATLIDSETDFTHFEKAEFNALEKTRVENNRPNLHDLPAGFFPAEVSSIDIAVSMKKGCYLGQETVARMYYKGKSHRGRYVIEYQTNTLPQKLFNVNEREIGVITSSIDNIAIAILRHDHAADFKLVKPD